jgi:hypothetical protein
MSSEAAAMSPGDGSNETSFLVQETVLMRRETDRKRTPVRLSSIDQQWSLIMSAFFTLIDREFCVACLAETQKHCVGG